MAVVLSEMADEIRTQLDTISGSDARLRQAALMFVDYWTGHPDHFRLVFMSNDVGRDDVRTFMAEDKTLAHFALFQDLVGDVMPDAQDVKVKTDTLIAGMIGIALCLNTIADYPWADAALMVDNLLANVGQ